MFQDAPLKEWSSNYREEYLAESLRLEGRGDAAQVTHCLSCGPSSSPDKAPLFRCSDCSGFLMECQDCCLRRHERLPFHLIKVRYLRTDCLPLLILDARNGTGPFSRRFHFERWAYATSWAISTCGVATPPPLTRTSLSWTPTAFTTLRLTSVAAKPRSLDANNYSGRIGILPLSTGLRRAQRDGCSNNFTYSPSPARSLRTTITMLSRD